MLNCFDQLLGENYDNSYPCIGISEPKNRLHCFFFNQLSLRRKVCLRLKENENILEGTRNTVLEMKQGRKLYYCSKDRGWVCRKPVNQFWDFKNRCNKNPKIKWDLLRRVKPCIYIGNVCKLCQVEKFATMA